MKFKMQKKRSSKMLALLLFIPHLGFAGVPAISSLYFDEGKVKTIFLAPTVPTLISFPCNVQNTLKDIAGNTEAAPEKGNPRNLVVWLKSPSQGSLSVLCERRVFVFNIQPSNSHQAYIKVLGSYGGPELIRSKNDQSQIITSSITSEQKKTTPIAKKVLMTSEGDSKW